LHSVAGTSVLGFLPPAPFRSHDLEPTGILMKMAERKFKVPHTLVILFSMVILAQILTYLIPAGSFDRVENASGRLQVVPGSFHLTPNTPALSPLAALTATQKLILAVAGIAMALLLYGMSQWHWGLDEMQGVFVALTLIVAIIARMKPDRVAVEFSVGAASLTGVALLIGVARGIQVVLDEGGVVDTMVYGISVPIQQLPGAVSAVGMFFVQSLANFFIPSGSGQAFVTMPIMAPLSDLVGVSRQVAVLAFQFGDGFSNILIPTQYVLVGILAMAGVPYDRWLRFILPFMVKIVIVGSIALMVAVWIGYD
jgi:uncharacterized ion transporter superfamily protein YfcC